MSYCRTCWAEIPAELQTARRVYCCDQCVRIDRRAGAYLRRIPADRPPRVRAYLQRVGG